MAVKLLIQNREAALILKLLTRQFTLVRGDILLWQQGTDDPAIAEGKIQENRTSDLPITMSGRYDFWLPRMEVQLINSRELFVAAGLPIPFVAQFSDEDVTLAESDVVVPHTDFYRVTMINATRSPVPHGKLIFGYAGLTEEAFMDANGTRLLYGNPMGCQSIIEPHHGLIIERL